MKLSILVAGMLAVAALPLVAQAQPYDEGCVQANHDNNVAGTVVGGIAGAIIGGAIGGHAQRGAGVVIGGVTGAVAGNAIARSNDHPCPDGYVYQGGQYEGGPPPPPPQGPAAYGFWNGAPTGLHDRIDFMQSRIETSAQRGWISGREYEQLNGELDGIRQEDEQLHERDGGHLYPQDRDYLQGRLDDLSQRLHWEASY